MNPASRAPSAEDSWAAQPARLRWALLVVCLGSLLGPLDTSVNVAFPLITSSFGLELSDIQWIVAAYIIAQSGLTLAFGQLGDLYGHRRIFRLGMAACAVTHLLCALAPGYGWLIGARVAQGVAVGLAMACGPALATLMFPAAMRRPILAMYVTLLGLGIALGPLIGGLLLQWGGWQSVFLYRAPWALLIWVLAYWLPEPKVERNSAPKFDYWGAALLTLSLASLILLISMARRGDASLLSVSAFACLFAGLLWAFVRHESRFSQPILHIKYLRDREFRRLQLASMVLNLSGFSIFLLLPYALVGHLHLGTLACGLMLAISPGGAIFAGIVSQRTMAHWPADRLMVTGMALCALGLGLLGVILSQAALWPLGLSLLLTGLGIGLFQIGYMDRTTSILPPSERGVAGSLLNVTRVVGAVIGAASLTWMLEGWRSLYPGLSAFQWSFGTVGAGLLLFVSWYGAGYFLPKPRR